MFVRLKAALFTIIRHVVNRILEADRPGCFVRIAVNQPLRHRAFDQCPLQLCALQSLPASPTTAVGRGRTYGTFGQTSAMIQIRSQPEKRIQHIEAARPALPSLIRRNEASRCVGFRAQSAPHHMMQPNETGAAIIAKRAAIAITTATKSNMNPILLPRVPATQDTSCFRL